MKKFNEIYLKVCEDAGRELEELRIKNLKRIIIPLLLSFIISVFLVIKTKNIIFLLIVLIVMTIDYYTNKSYNNYKKLFKEKIIKEFVKNYSKKLQFCPEEGIPERSYLNAEFENISELNGEDLIRGPLTNDIYIYMAEVRAKKERIDSDGDTEEYQVFHGIFVEADLTKKVRHTMKIRKNSTIQGRRIGETTKLNMDSIEFEKNFDVYTTNKIESMQILTADIMQMIVDFKNNNKIVPEITLKENILYIRFRTGNIFEPKFIRSALDFDTLKKYYDIITFTIELTEKFSKNILEIEI